MFSGALLAGRWNSGPCATRRIPIPPWLLSTWKTICSMWRRSHPKPSLVSLTLRDSFFIHSRSSELNWWATCSVRTSRDAVRDVWLHHSSREKPDSVQSARSFHHHHHSSLLQSLFLNSSVDCNGSDNLKYALICWKTITVHHSETILSLNVSIA